MNDQVNSEALGRYMRDSAYVWHNMMGGGTTGAFMKMLSGGLVDHYVENDKGFREFVNAQDPLDKMQIIKKYRKDDKGWQFADTDEEIMEKLNRHGLDK
jgi:hypothetical protein